MTRIRHVRPDGIIESVKGSNREEVDLPIDVAAAPDGSLLVATIDNRVWRLAEEGALTAFAGDGRNEHDGDGGPAVRAGILMPEAVEAMPDGTVYIAQDDGRLRRVALDGAISTVRGSFGFSDLAPGPAGLRSRIGARDVTTYVDAAAMRGYGRKTAATREAGRNRRLYGTAPRMDRDAEALRRVAERHVDFATSREPRLAQLPRRHPLAADPASRATWPTGWPSGGGWPPLRDW